MGEFLCGSGNITVMLRIEEHSDSSAANNAGTQPAKYGGNLSENNKAQKRGKKDLGIIIDRKLPGRGKGISCRNGKLTACRRNPGQQKKYKLLA